MSEPKAYFCFVLRPSPPSWPSWSAFLARREQWPVGCDGGIVIDHAMGRKEWKKERRRRKQPDESFTNSSPAVDCIHRILIFAFTNCRGDGVWLSFRTPSQRVLVLVVCVRASCRFIYFAVDFNFSSIFHLEALFPLFCACEAVVDKADKALREKVDASWMQSSS